MDVKNKRYRLYDYAEAYGVVDYYDTLDEIKEAADEWHEDTDGDCDLVFQEWNERLGGYFEIDN